MVDWTLKAQRSELREPLAAGTTWYQVHTFCVCVWLKGGSMEVQKNQNDKLLHKVSYSLKKKIISFPNSPYSDSMPIKPATSLQLYVNEWANRSRSVLSKEEETLTQCSDYFINLEKGENERKRQSKKEKQIRNGSKTDETNVNTRC